MARDLHDVPCFTGDILHSRSILLSGCALAFALSLAAAGPLQAQTPATAPQQPTAKLPNILVIFGDDIGQSNISAYSFGHVGYKTPNIDRIAREG